MYLRNTKPSTMCLYSAASTFFLNLFAASHSWFLIGSCGVFFFGFIGIYLVIISWF